MSIFDQKTQVMGKIATLNVLTETLPKLRVTNSFSSINNSGNATDFLIDLVRSLIGYGELRRNIVDIITRKLPQIELEIKNSLKSDLKNLISCNINPTIPTWFRSGGPGININLSNLDFFDITKINPNSPTGSLFYSDTQTNLFSTDFNTFLYSNIELNRASYTTNGGQYSTWGSSTFGEDILDVRFSPIGLNENNVVNFKCNQNFDNKTLNEFNNHLIDSINLFGSPNTINSSKVFSSIIENMFGTVSFNLGKSKEQIKKEVEIEEVLKSILNNDDDVIDDSFFTFTNEQISFINETVKNKSKGVNILETCGKLSESIPLEVLIDINNNISNSINQSNNLSAEENEVNAVNNAIDTIANIQANSVLDVDKPTIRVNFLLDLVKRLVQSIINIILSPKLITIYAVNHQLVYGQGTTFNGAIDFMRKNKTLIKNISKSVLEFILRMLTALALKYITQKVSQKIVGDNIERNKNYVAQILSLLGIPSENVRQIRELGNLII